MPIGPNGEKRPTSVVQAAVMACRIATGEIKEVFVSESKDELKAQKADYLSQRIEKPRQPAKMNKITD